MKSTIFPGHISQRQFFHWMLGVGCWMFGVLPFGVLPLPFASGQTPLPQQVAVAADKTIRGPYSVAPKLAAGETAVALTGAQYAALDAVRHANPAVTRFAFDGTNFTVAPIEQLRLGLLAIYNSLPAGEQELFQPQMQGVKRRLAAHDVAGALLIVTLSGTGMPQDIATARTQMLAQFTQYFPSVTVTP